MAHYGNPETGHPLQQTMPTQFNGLAGMAHYANLETSSVVAINVDAVE